MKKPRKTSELNIRAIASGNGSRGNDAALCAQTVDLIIEKLVADGYARPSATAVVTRAVELYAKQLGIEPPKKQELP